MQFFNNLETNFEPQVNELNAVKSRLFDVFKHYKKLKVKFHKLHEDYQKLNEVAEVLTVALENSVKGQPVNLSAILQSCMKIFPNRFHRDIQTDSEVKFLFLKRFEFAKLLLTKKKSFLRNYF